MQKVKQKVLNYTAVFRQEPEGGYTVVVPSLQGCVTYGETFEKAKEMAEDAIEGYLMSDIPKGTLGSILREAGISRDEFLSV